MGKLDPELLDKEKFERPIYPKDLHELVKRLGGSEQLQRRPENLPKTLPAIRKQLELELRGEREDMSEIGYIKRILIVILKELETP